jgi:hypothetical protein
MRRIELQVLLVTFLLGTLVQCKSQPPVFDEAEWLVKVKSTDAALLYAPHVNNEGTYFNPWMERENHRMGSWRSYKKKQFDTFNEEKYSAQPNDYTYLSDPGFNSISFVGHASLIIKMDRKTIFTDPFFSNSAVVVGKKVKSRFDYSQIPQRPVVLISHNQ